jgi:hypothetical protein
MPEFTEFTTYVREMFVSLFPVISSEEWAGSDWTPEQRAELNKFMHLLNNVYNDKLRRAYDATIWAGHKSGKVATTLEPVRKETVRGDAAKKVAPTADALFDEMAN